MLTEPTVELEDELSAVGGSEGEFRAFWEVTFERTRRAGAVADPATGCLRAVNPAFAAMHGGRIEDFVGRPLASVYTAKGAERLSSLAREAHENGYVQYESENVRLDGSVFPVRVEAMAARDQAGGLLYRVGWFEDLTEERQAAEEERRSRERFEKAFSHAPIGMSLVSLEGRFMYVNAALCQITGYGEAALTRKTFQELTHPDDLEADLAELDRLMRGEIQSYRMEKRYFCADGEVVWVLLSASLVRNEAGEPDHFIAQIENISEKRRTEQALRRASRYFELSEDLVCTAGFDGVFREVGEAWTRVLGWSREELCSRPFVEFVHPDDRASTEREAEKLAEDGATVLFVNRCRTKAGGWCWLEWSARAVMEEQRIYAAARVVTARKTMEADLRAAHGELAVASEERRVILDSLAEGILSADTDGRNTFANRAALELSGFSAEELLGRGQHEMIHHTRADGTPYPLEECPMYDLLQSGGVVRRDDEVFWRKDGTSFPVEYVSAPVRKEGRVVGAVVAFNDVTERKRAEAQVEEARDRALDASRAKSAFLANMSHEIRTPMNGVLGMTELLLGTELDEEQHEFARVVSSSADALLRVIDDILDFSKIEAGKLELDPGHFDPRESVADVGKMLSEGASEKRLDLVWSTRDEVPATVWADQGRFRQVLTNVISNAIKFTSAGGVAVDVSCSQPDGPDTLLRVEVSDTGIGIEASKVLELFDPFHQADVSTTRRYGGTGLGLAISRQLVELMGGEIGVRSVLGEGSTFWFTIRCAAAEAPTAAQTHSRAEAEERTATRNHAAADRRGAAVDRDEAAADRDHYHAEADQRTWDRGRAAADREGAAVDREAAAAARDQSLAEADSRTSDRDHAAADRLAAAADREANAVARDLRQGEADSRTSDRDHAAAGREAAAAIREQAAAARDRTQGEADSRTSDRDHAAAGREDAAAIREAAAAARDQTQAEADRRTSDRDDAAAGREGAAVDREAAAAARDQTQADADQRTSEREGADTHSADPGRT